MAGGASPRQVEPTEYESAPAPTNGRDDDDRYGKVRSALGPGTVIQGKLSFDTPVRIDGKLSGEIFSSKALIVGPQGWIDAQVEVATLVVMGTVKGNVKVSERVELRAGGRLDGDIEAPAFSMAEGSFFNGRCSMTSAKSAERGTSSSRTDLKSGAESKSGTDSKPESTKAEAKESAKGGSREGERSTKGSSSQSAAASGTGA